MYVEAGNIFMQGIGMTLETVAGVEAQNNLVWIDFIPSKSTDVPVESAVQ